MSTVLHFLSDVFIIIPSEALLVGDSDVPGSFVVGAVVIGSDVAILVPDVVVVTSVVVVVTFVVVVEDSVVVVAVVAVAVSVVVVGSSK